jgi:hypothetical protein
MNIPRFTVASVLTGVLVAAAGPAAAADAFSGVDDLAIQIERAVPGEQQYRVAVTEFQDPTGVASDMSRFVADRLTMLLARNPRMMLLERRFLGDLLRQLKLKRADLARPENAKLLAKGYGLDMVVVGTLTDFGTLVNLEARMIDVSSGETVGYASTNVAKDAKVTRMLEIGRDEAGR